MSVFPCLSILITQNPAFNFEVLSGRGLVVEAKGIPVIRGSGFQFYAPGWTKGYYSSNWTLQNVKHVDGDTVETSFARGAASGKATYHRAGNKLTVDYSFNWDSAEPCQIELNSGLIWEPPFHGGFATLDLTQRNLPAVPPTGDLGKRLLGASAMTTSLNGSAVKLTTRSSEALSTFDGRKYDMDWAREAPVYWQGALGLAIHRGEPKKVHVEYTIDATDAPAATPAKLDVPLVSAPDAVLPDTSVPPLIPTPKMSLLDYNHPLVLTNNWSLPAGRPKFFDLLKSELDRRFDLPAPSANGVKVQFDGGMSDFKKPEGTYHIRIEKGSISVYGQEAAGLRNGIYRLVQLAFVKDGNLCMPTGILEDEPRSDFRGVHLFVGPKAPDFHQKLWTNVLRPLGMNKVVLQCERTNWKSLPGVESPITMKTEDLAKLFAWYRSIEVEPIPLIQSFGHMEWAFANGKNRDLAINPNEPYALDPRKPEARDMIGKVWDEAVSLLHPKTIHVGLDEVDMVGFPKKDPALVTELWKIQLPFLGEVAKRNNVNLMLWGDEGLSTKEAIDATNGDDPENAKQRRAAIPRGATIADWHYKPEESHVPFLTSLKTWKDDGFHPIASMWYRPENIRGYSIAADVESVGTLQTTWNGYESSEDNMLYGLNQYSALILAADYGWSARLEKVNELPYDPMAIFAKMYNLRRSPLKPTSGSMLGSGAAFYCGGIRFNQLANGSMAGISATNSTSPSTISVDLTGTAQELAIAMETAIASPEGESVGSVAVTYMDGSTDQFPIRYGIDVRSDSDDKAIFRGVREKDRCCARFTLKPKTLKAVSISEANRYSGLKIDGLTLVPLKGKRG